jgi:hypothetical protein
VANLTPDYIVTASLTSDVGDGSMTFSTLNNSLSAELMPFFVGPKGAKGDKAIIELDENPNNRLRSTEAGLYVPPVAEAELPDMAIIFENALI